MMALLFLLLFIAYLLVHFGRRKPALGFFFVSLLMAVYWFRHHVTEKLDLHF